MSENKTDLGYPGEKKGPKKKFFPDLEQVEKLCRLNCTDDEIASFFGVCRKTVERERKSNPEFNDVIERGKSYGKLSLRRKQVELAHDGNPTMLIWLGKVYLGQRENIAVEHSGEVNHKNLNDFYSGSDDDDKTDA